MAPHCCVSQAFRRRFAGVSQCFADVSRMFRGRFAGCFARFARVSRGFAAVSHGCASTIHPQSLRFAPWELIFSHFVLEIKCDVFN